MPRVVRRSQLIKRRVRHRRHKFRQLFTLSFANPYHSEPTHRVRRHRPRLPCATEPSLHRGGTHAKSLGRRSNRKPFILHNFDHPLTHLDRQRLWHRDPLDTVRSHLDLRRNSKGAISDQPAREPLYWPRERSCVSDAPAPSGGECRESSRWRHDDEGTVDEAGGGVAGKWAVVGGVFAGAGLHGGWAPVCGACASEG